jgi:hypothetical protein
MSTFLDHLAGMALGASAAGAARPSLPSRFAQPRARPDGGWTEMRGGQSTVPSSSPAGPLMPGVAPIRRTSDDMGNSARQFSSQDAVNAQHAATANVKAGSLPGDAGSVATPVGPSRRQPSPMAAVPTDIGGSDRSANRDPEPTPDRPLMTAVTKPAALPEPMTPAPTFEAASGPLTGAAIAGRVQAAMEARVVHVTIDRIDVRAPAAVKSTAAERPQRSQPSISLADYLSKHDAGGRA